MVNALRDAEKLGFDTVQVFTKNQQQWQVKPLEQAAIDEWRAEQSRLAWDGRTVSHASYLINLASHNDELWRKSLDLMTVEIERCEALGIAFLVHHPGSSTGTTRDAGLANIARAYAELLRRTAGYRTVLCLENTAGAGSTIGGDFAELARLRAMILEAAPAGARVGFCLDTCHMHAFGYDLGSRAGAERALREFDELCGMDHLRVLHLNDSKAKAGSKLDRHQHIGEGTIGGGDVAASGFSAVVNAPGLKGVPKILETPKEDNDGGIPWDTVNLARLKSLQGGSGGETKQRAVAPGRRAASKQPQPGQPAITRARASKPGPSNPSAKKKSRKNKK